LTHFLFDECRKNEFHASNGLKGLYIYIYVYSFFLFETKIYQNFEHVRILFFCQSLRNKNIINS